MGQRTGSVAIVTVIYYAAAWNWGVHRDPVCPKIATLISWAAEHDQSKSSVRDWDFIWQQSFVRSLAVDSGAFSFLKYDKSPSVDDYIDFIKARGLHQNQNVDMVFSLDVIGDWRATQRNTDRLWAAGIKAVPTWHAGSPIDVLKGIARDYPRIAIGGLAGKKMRHAREQIISDAFAHVWPCRIHGFGIHKPEILDRFPFDSVDATSEWMNVCMVGTINIPSGGAGSAPERFNSRKVFPRKLSSAAMAHESRLPMNMIARNILNLEHRYSMRWGKELSRWR